MIRALVPLPTDIRPGDALTVVGNFGATLSSEKTLSQRRVSAFAPGEPGGGEGFLADEWLGDPFLDADDGGGFLGDFFLQSAFLEPERVIEVELAELFGYGPFTIAVVPKDRLGQADAGAPATTQIFVAEPPLPVAEQRFAGYDADDGTVEFNVTVTTWQQGGL